MESRCLRDLVTARMMEVRSEGMIPLIRSDALKVVVGSKSQQDKALNCCCKRGVKPVKAVEESFLRIDILNLLMEGSARWAYAIHAQM